MLRSVAKAYRELWLGLSGCCVYGELVLHSDNFPFNRGTSIGFEVRLQTKPDPVQEVCSSIRTSGLSIRSPRPLLCLSGLKGRSVAGGDPSCSEGATLMGLGTFPFRAGGECCVYGELALHSDNFPFNQGTSAGRNQLGLGALKLLGSWGPCARDIVPLD